MEIMDHLQIAMFSGMKLGSSNSGDLKTDVKKTYSSQFLFDRVKNGIWF